MHTVMASGESTNSRDWAQAVLNLARGNFETSTLLSYQHWEAGGETDVEAEAAHMALLMEQQRGPYIVVAKSIGTLVAQRAIQQVETKPAASVFIGTPYGWKKTELDPLLAKHTIPTLFIQQEHDRAGSAQTLATMLDGLRRPYGFRVAAQQNLTVVAGSDHHYADVPQIANLITDYAHSQEPVYFASLLETVASEIRNHAQHSILDTAKFVQPRILDFARQLAPQLHGHWIAGKVNYSTYFVRSDENETGWRQVYIPGRLRESYEYGGLCGELINPIVQVPNLSRYEKETVSQGTVPGIEITPFSDNPAMEKIIDDPRFLDQPFGQLEHARQSVLMPIQGILSMTFPQFSSARLVV